MFQYAWGYALAREHKAEMSLDVTALLLTRHESRDFMLDRLDVDVLPRRQGAVEALINKLSGSQQPLLRAPAALARAALGLQDAHETTRFAYAPPRIPHAGRVRLIGFWQAYPYFNAYADDIRRQFQVRRAPTGPAATMLETIRATPNAVSLHVRRGDYLQVWPEAVLPVDYYRRAVAELKRDLGEVTVFMFSDDLPWAIENLALDAPVTPVALNHDDTPEEDLRLMAACDHHIIANSSFSWWGAWMNPNPARRVIAPRRWLDRDFHPDLYPPDWTPIAVDV